MNQILSQDEINALLRGLSEEDDSGISDDSGGASINYKKFDLANQERIIRGRMPTMELIHDRFTRQFRTALSKFLGRTCFANVGAIESVKFGLFMKKLPLPSSLHIFRMPPLNGFALMVVSAPLVFGIIDSLFGGSGRGKVKIEGREYTPIEIRLIGRVVMTALDVLREAWAPIHPVDFVYVRSEFNPLAVAIVPPTDLVVIVTIEIELEQESASLSICTPYSTIEPLRGKLSAGFQSTRLEVDTDVKGRLQTNIMRSTAQLSVQVARGILSARKMCKLKIGDVLQLDTRPDDPALVLVEGRPKFFAKLGKLRGSKAVKVIGPIPDRELINLKNEEELLAYGHK